ncbi:MAG: hypothetical protein QOH10_1517 [Actinomycetota bacterium]|jgi:Na+-transporting methylmalonyl-CoA/oxaloacetate decarboxylase gamma subunit|nr:hypothetical protein [Actinomycetota bacterium]
MGVGLVSDVSQGAGWWQASDGKWYPPQPPPPMSPPPPVVPQKNRHGCLAIVGGVAIVVILLIILAVVFIAVGAKSTSKSETTGATFVAGPAPKADYKVGDTAKTSDLQITVYGFKDPQPPTDSFNTPQPGDHFVSVDVQVTNPGSNQRAFSSLLGFHLLDAQNRQYDEDLGSAGLKPGAPDGQIAGGQSIRGYVVFEIPDGTTGLRFRAQGSITAAGAVFVL